jgi:hypothetical protein
LDYEKHRAIHLSKIKQILSASSSLAITHITGQSLTISAANAIGCHLVIFQTHCEEKEIQALNML